MEVYHSKEEEFITLTIDGELDASSCLVLDESIQQVVSENEKKILVDCKQLSYISSAGLGVFMSYLQDFAANDTRMVLFNLNPQVKEVFRILGLDNLLKIVTNKDEAKLLANAVKF
ncbi:MAG: STAS domain-containing protein [Opitutaceae bacterium]|nr:STAS domain-containing protein [Cytophagales bacterium]